CTVDSCDGVDVSCQHAPGNAGTVCRPATDPICDPAETCTGASAICPPDQFAPADTPCRASAGVCDQGESCTGSSPACPADAKRTGVCRSAAGPCDVAESCDGVGD